MDQLLYSIYYNPRNKASVSSIYKLYKEAKRRNSRITLEAVRNWLQSQTTYTLHVPARRTWKRNRVIVHGINEEFQADLVDMQKYARQNNRYRHILTVIDVLSKYAWVLPLKKKTAGELERAFTDLFHELSNTDRIPEKLRTDRGTEFRNERVRKILDKYRVYHSLTNDSKMKCSVIERFNRTLKTRIWKWFTHTNSHRYIDELQNFVDGYNSSIHRSIKMAPKDVTISNQDVALRNLYGGKTMRDLLIAASATKHNNLKEGDVVRIHEKSKTFEKGYQRKWSDKIYFIKQIIKVVPRPMYILKNRNGREIGRRYYFEEIQKVRPAPIQ
jgi:transposase InsO family protein